MYIDIFKIYCWGQLKGWINKYLEYTVRQGGLEDLIIQGMVKGQAAEEEIQQDI